jgi:methylmalonyl-CoA mutase N-terminal domain/subunit
VNEFIDGEKATLPIMTIDESVERDQVARLQAFRDARTRDWQTALQALDEAAGAGTNLMPFIVDAVRNECTIGEIVGTLKKTFGEHTEQGF